MGSTNYVSKPIYQQMTKPNISDEVRMQSRQVIVGD